MFIVLRRHCNYNYKYHSERFARDADRLEIGSAGAFWEFRKLKGKTLSAVGCKNICRERDLLLGYSNRMKTLAANKCVKGFFSFFYAAKVCRQYTVT